ncbi:MAG: S9 family peptidase, partial [Bacteroidetes bacterium]
PQQNLADTIFVGYNDARQFAISQNGQQVSFVAERDSSTKALQKFYKLYHHKAGADSAMVIAHRSSPGKIDTWQISPDADISFSKTGQRLFFGVAPVGLPKDTLTPDIDKVSLDVWHHNDDYIQPAQLRNQDRESKRSYLAQYDVPTGKLLQLADLNLETIATSNEGDGALFAATTNKPYRKESQWTGGTRQDVYAINPANAALTPVITALDGQLYGPSPAGNHLVWYNNATRQYHTFSSSGGIKTISKGITVPLADEENDLPDDPRPYGIMGWEANDAAVYVYDRYDIWKLDPTGIQPPQCITQGQGRKRQWVLRYTRTNPEERFLQPQQQLLLEVFNENDKSADLVGHQLGTNFNPGTVSTGPHAINSVLKAKNANIYSFSTESFTQSPNLCTVSAPAGGGLQPQAVSQAQRIFQPNAQQAGYNWGTAQLMRFTMLDGKASQGILYKPENFDSTKKYPVILYFYERNANNLHNYIAPQPIRSSINISYYVSNGYLVFDPNIYYKTGQPGPDAYNSVVAAAQMLAKRPWVAADKMAIQGHSWGGYQVAYLLTRTGMFAAAEAGAPVANMTSAYGGIRWGAGISRQFQYERSQSRLGATLWQKPELYLKNSPLFTANQITTPLLMMHNDQDDAVPWYQGIEMYSAMRRLGKKVWMLNYNGELHGLTERKNRKDWTERLQQFFDHYLKGAPAPTWLAQGLPATQKGKTMGLK